MQKQKHKAQGKTVINAKALAHCLQDVFDNVTTTVHEISTEDQFPEFEVKARLNDVLYDMKAVQYELPSLLVIAYVGQGGIDDTTGSLTLLSPTGRQGMQWTFLEDSFFRDTQDPFVTNVHTLGLLDCCYETIHEQTQTIRPSQILAACAPEESTLLEISSSPYFIQRFTQACYDIRNEYPALITVDGILGQIQREKPDDAPDAQLTIIGGVDRYLPVCFAWV